MFAQKLQNPFLKPTPYFSSNSYAGLSSAPPLPPTNKYSAYPSYEIQRSPRYESYASNNQRFPQTSQLNKYRPSADISDILRNNPFNRPANQIFSSSSANNISPAKYDISKNQQNNCSNSYERKQFNNSYSNPRTNYAPNEGVTNQYSQNRLTPRKHDNYLSTSSADSATTYINKIYQLDDDRSDGFAPPSNPFFRKNLIEEKTFGKEARPANSYDNATMKYIAGQRQYQKPPYLQNNYLSGRQEYPPYQTKNKSKQYLPHPRDYSDLEGKKDPFGSQKSISYKDYDDPTNHYLDRETYNYEKEPINVGSKKYIDNKYEDKHQDTKYDKYGSKYDKYGSKYNKYDKQESKYNKYDKYEYKHDLPKETYISKHDQQMENYKSYKYEERHKDLENSDRFDFSQSQHKKESKKYIVSEIKDQFAKDKYEVKRGNNQGIQSGHKYSFKRQSNDYSHKDLAKQSKRSQERVAFPQSQNSYESSKHKQKEYIGAFETLGGIASSKYKQDAYNYQPGVGSKKLISSQVEQYEKHREDISYKPKEYQNSLQAHERPKDRQKFTHYEQEEGEEDYTHLKSKKGPVRDVDQEYPAVIHYNGVVFSRVEVK